MLALIAREKKLLRLDEVNEEARIESRQKARVLIGELESPHAGRSIRH